RETECFHGPLVNNEAEMCWLLEWEISGACSSQDSRRKVRRAIVNFAHIWAIRHQPAVADKESIFVNRWQLLLGGKLKDPLAIERSQRIRYQDGIGTVAHHCGECSSKIVRLTYTKWLYFYTQCPCRRLGRSVTQRHPEIVRIPKHGDLAQARKRIFEDLQPLGRELGCEFSDARDCATRARQAINQARRNRIGTRDHNHRVHSSGL